jgi:DNA-binding response OmpR family regulator
MLTALGQSDDITRGLGHGADDYVTKPFECNVLVARARAVLRRATNPYNSETDLSTYSDGYLAIDLNKHQVQVRGKDIKLSTKEYRVLAHLLKNAGQVLTFQQILENVWGWEYQDHLEYVHAYVWRLRQKIEADPQNPVYLLTEYGTGYRFEKLFPN